MERRKLIKADIDRVRDIEGFPIGTDEDIIALSDAPFYTACPNPFIEEFIREYGTPYDETTDDYHREPYTVDISEGKHDPLYMVHSYHTKVPYRAIMQYIMHYTKPGDLVFDGFCGTGMAGVAAQLCGDYSTCDKVGIKDNSNIGRRQAILVDLSPEATFIAHNYNNKIDVLKFELEAQKILEECHRECDWVYETDSEMGLLRGKGRINYTIWSEVYICPNCCREFIFWDIAVEKSVEKSVKKPRCLHCNALLKREDCQKSMSPIFDAQNNEISMQSKCVPIRINYNIGKKRFTKAADKNDLDMISKLEKMSIEYWYPSNLMMHIGEEWGDYWRAGYHVGISRTNHFYTKRNLYVLAKCNDCIDKVQDKANQLALRFWMSSIYSRSHKLNRYMPDHHRHVGPLSGTLYIPYFQAEINILSLLEEKLSSVLNLASIPSRSIVSTQSSTNLRNIPDKSIDYIFVDPPFGDNLHYSELNFIQESWLKCFTNNQNEAIINASQKKSIDEYQGLIEKCFREFFRILKPNRWITIEFHNSKNAVWISIQEALQKAGFIVFYTYKKEKTEETAFTVDKSSKAINEQLGLMPLVAPYIAEQEAELKKARLLLSDNFLTDINTIAVEGKTDRYYIQKAIEVHSPYLQKKIDEGTLRILTKEEGCGTTQLCDWAIAWTCSGFGSKLYILFDKDAAGIKAKKDVDNNPTLKDRKKSFRSQHIQSSECMDSIFNKGIEFTFEIEHLFPIEVWEKFKQKKVISARVSEELYSLLKAHISLDKSINAVIDELFHDATHLKDSIVTMEVHKDKKVKASAIVKLMIDELGADVVFAGFKRTIENIENTFR